MVELFSSWENMVMLASHFSSNTVTAEATSSAYSLCTCMADNETNWDHFRMCAKFVNISFGLTYNNFEKAAWSVFQQ